MAAQDDLHLFLFAEAPDLWGAAAAAAASASNEEKTDGAAEQKLRPVLFMAFRGTDNVQDVLVDVRATAHNDWRGKVHQGFWRRMETVPMSFVLDALANGQRVVLTGHSLGGAVATLFTLKLVHQLDT